MKNVVKMDKNQTKKPKLFIKALFPSLVYLIIGSFDLFFSLSYNKSLIPVDIVSMLCIIAGLGILLKSYWAFVLALIVFPPLLTIKISALSYSTSIAGFNPNIQTLLFHIFLIILALLLVLSFLYLLALKKEFKKSAKD